MLIKNNQKALMVNHLIIFVGMVMIGVSTFLFQKECISPPLWMILIGTGLTPEAMFLLTVFSSTDCLLHLSMWAAVGFLIYVADAFGYLGSIGVLVFKEFRICTTQLVRVFLFGRVRHFDRG